MRVCFAVPASITQNIGCPSVMVPSNMGKTKNLIMLFFKSIPFLKCHLHKGNNQKYWSLFKFCDKIQVTLKLKISASFITTLCATNWYGIFRPLHMSLCLGFIIWLVLCDIIDPMDLSVWYYIESMNK